MSETKGEKLIKLAKRRGIFWQSFELYGGVSGFLDYGPLGSLLKRRIEDKWLDWFVRRQGIMLVETPIVTPSKVFEASGHLEEFTDPIVECKSCSRKWRADHLLEEQAGISGEGMSLDTLGRALLKNRIGCPECGGELSRPSSFNELFKTTIGPYSENEGYCRPETAQGIFTNFRRLSEIARGKLPFGVAQIGRCLRNEIAPRQGPIRLRELTIMEIELFFDPEDEVCDKFSEVSRETIRILPEELLSKGDEEPIEITAQEAVEDGYIEFTWNAYFMALAKKYVSELGIPESEQFFLEKKENKRAHYATQTFDQLVRLLRWGWVEVSGHACRSDYDLNRHAALSKVDLSIFKPYPSPKRRQRVKVILERNNVRKDFGEEEGLLYKLIEESDPEELKGVVEKRGVAILREGVTSFKVTNRHVSFSVEEVEETGRHLIPYVVEPSFGVDRLLYATCEYALTEKEGRTIMRFPLDVVPIQLGVFPLVTKDHLPEKAKTFESMLRDEGFSVEYDEAGSIGRRYARADESGIPIALTVDYQTLEDDSVTLRSRDTWSQVRADIKGIPGLLRDYFLKKIGFMDLGVSIEE